MTSIQIGKVDLARPGGKSKGKGRRADEPASERKAIDHPRDGPHGSKQRWGSPSPSTTASANSSERKRTSRRSDTESEEDDIAPEMAAFLQALKKMSKAGTPKKVRQHGALRRFTPLLSPPKASEEKRRHRSPAPSDRTSEYGSEASSKTKKKEPQEKHSPRPRDHNPDSTRRPRTPSPDTIPLTQGSPTSTAFATVGATQDVGYATPARIDPPRSQSYSEWATRMQEPTRASTATTGPHRNPRRTHVDSKRGRPKWYFPEKTFKGEWVPGILPNDGKSRTTPWIGLSVSKAGFCYTRHPKPTGASNSTGRRSQPVATPQNNG